MSKLAHPLCSYGELRFHFKHALKGANLLKLAFIPKEFGAVNYLMYVVLALLLISFAAIGLIDAVWTFPTTLLMEGIFFHIAERCIWRGVRLAFPKNSAVQNLERQQRKTCRALIRYAYFAARLAKEHAQPTVNELTNALKIAEIYRTGHPPGLSGFFRHPIVILVLGTLAFSFNDTIKKLPATADWEHFKQVFVMVVIFILFAGLAYTLRYLEPSKQWQFECCLSWQLIEKESRLESTKASPDKRLSLL